MPKFLKLLKNVVPLGLGLYLVYFSFANTSEEDRAQIIAAIKQADLRFVFLSLFFGVLSHLSRAYRWNYLLYPLGYQPKFIIRILTVMISYFSNLGIPRSGEVLRATALATYADVPFEKSFGTIVTERIIDFVLLFSLIGLGFILHGEFLLEVIGNPSLDEIPLVWMAFAATVFFLGIRQLKRSKRLLAVKIIGFFRGFWQGILSIRQMKHKWAFIVHTLFIWLMYLMMFWAVTLALPETSGLSFSTVIPAFVAGGFAMSATNGGIGLYPIAVAAVLQAFDIPYTQALAFGWVVWTGQTVMVVIFGSLSFLLLPVLSKK
jgi:uncharacterized protein (TIRG00374 family)|tara:strand:- start:137 stop:1093 length:957 start_codon:yes stop_codon:yes gene_type:complete